MVKGCWATEDKSNKCKTRADRKSETRSRTLRILPIKAFWRSPTVKRVNTHWLKVPVLPLSPSCFYAEAYGTEVSLKNIYSRGRQLENHVACDMCEDQMRRTKRKLIWELILPQGDAKCQCYSGQHLSSTTAPEPSLSYHLSILPQFSVSWVIWCCNLSLPITWARISPDSLFPPRSILERVTNSCCKAAVQICHHMSARREWKKEKCRI